MSSSSPFGPTFRKIREARGLSLKEVAADIVSPQFLSQFERSQKGVTIETFSRLLLSMGVDWDTFLSHYPGLTIQNFSPILMKHINQENMDFLAIIERLKHEKSPVAEENKELWQLYLRSLEINVNNAMGKEIHLEDAPVSIKRIKKCLLPIKMKLNKTSPLPFYPSCLMKWLARFERSHSNCLKVVILPTLPMHWPLCC